MTPERERASNLSERVYRALLAAYPKTFRREYGPRMERTFKDQYLREYRRGGWAWLLRVWVSVGRDLISSAFVERGHQLFGEERRVSNYKLASLGFVLLAAPLFFVAASLLKYEAGLGLLFDPLEMFLSEPGRREVFNVLSPVVFLGGLGLALAVNLHAVLQPTVNRENGAIVCVVRPEMKLANIAVAAVSSLLLVTLVGYVLLENFTYR